MELENHWMPLEVIRRFRLFLHACVDDGDYRYPEVRQRIALEFEAVDDAENREWALAVRQWANRKLSWFEWRELVFLHEGTEQRRFKKEIFNTLQNSPASNSSPVLTEILERLQWIATIVSSDSIEEDQPLWKFLRFRWFHTGLRDEAKYLIQRTRYFRRS